jgi:membrane-associated phospholipid phosphatase
LVTYSVGNDFSFQVTRPSPCLARWNFPAWASAPSLSVLGLLALCEISVVLVLRNHYTMDVITGAAMAFAVWMTLNRWWPSSGEPRD